MPIATPADQQWVDIVPPDVPAQALDAFTSGILLALLLMAIATGVYLYRRPRWRARRKLHGLARELQASRVTIKAACWQVQKCLRSGLGQHRLQAVRWPEDCHADWLVYVNRLTQCCFAAEPPARSELDSIIHEALAWLKRKVADS